MSSVSKCDPPRPLGRPLLHPAMSTNKRRFVTSERQKSRQQLSRSRVEGGFAWSLPACLGGGTSFIGIFRVSQRALERLILLRSAEPY